MISPSSDLDHRQRRIYSLAIAITVLIVYLPALAAGYLPIDDGDMLQAVQSGRLSVSQLLLGGGKEYYRPLVPLSLMGDNLLFGGRTAGYHLCNILFHLFNSLLVFRLALLFFKGTQQMNCYAFLSGLLFAVHPVNSETVVWISCRPDLLCCFFSLLFLSTLFQVVRHSGPLMFACIGLFFLCSLLAKEASLFLLPAAACYFLLERKNIDFRTAAAALSALLFALIVYLMLRKGLSLFSQPLRADSSAHSTVRSIAAIDAIAAFGFYIRKLLFPFPLSFTITKINSNIYAALSLFFAAAAAILWKQSVRLRIPMIFLAASLAPPIGAMLLLPIWTPYAERYLYLPSVFFVLCTVVLLRWFGNRIPLALLVACTLTLAVPTALRVRLWTNPLHFWQKAVEQAPGMGTARLVLASEYLKAGQYGKADENLRNAIGLGLPKQAQESSLEIRRQLDEKLRSANEVVRPSNRSAPSTPTPLE